MQNDENLDQDQVDEFGNSPDTNADLEGDAVDRFRNQAAGNDDLEGDAVDRFRNEAAGDRSLEGDVTDRFRNEATGDRSLEGDAVDRFRNEATGDRSLEGDITDRFRNEAAGDRSLEGDVIDRFRNEATRSTNPAGDAAERFQNGADGNAATGTSGTDLADNNMTDDGSAGRESSMTLQALGLNVSTSANGKLQVGDIAGSAFATRAGLQSGDIIRSIDGQRLSSLSDANALLQNLQPGDVIEMQVVRDGELQDLSVRIPMSFGQSGLGGNARGSGSFQTSGSSRAAARLRGSSGTGRGARRQIFDRDGLTGPSPNP